MNARLERTGGLKNMFFEPSPSDWKGNECQDLLYKIIKLINRKYSWVRTLGQEAAIYRDWWGKAECQCLIVKLEAIIFWQQFPLWLCLFYNKLLKQQENIVLGRKHCLWQRLSPTHGLVMPALEGWEVWTEIENMEGAYAQWEAPLGF